MAARAGGAPPPKGVVLPFTGETLWIWPAIGLFVLGAGITLRLLMVANKPTGRS
jgi:bacteriorhodopsin